jgi:hypothetical protein
LCLLVAWEIWNERLGIQKICFDAHHGACGYQVKHLSLGGRGSKSFECYYVARVGFCILAFLAIL